MSLRYSPVRTIDRVWKIKTIFKIPKHGETLRTRDSAEANSPISSYFNDPYVIQELKKIKETFHGEELTDGRKILTTMKMKAPNTFYQEMLGTKDSFCTREFTEEKMKCVCNVGDIVTTAWYMRV